MAAESFADPPFSIMMMMVMVVVVVMAMRHHDDPRVEIGPVMVMMVVMMIGELQVLLLSARP